MRGSLNSKKLPQMFSSERIKLRPVEPIDLELLEKWENDTRVWRVSQTKVPFSRHLLEQYILSAQDIHLHGQLRFMIEMTEGVVGSIDLFEYDPVNSRAGVGILVDEQSREKGIASGALQLLVKYCKEVLMIDQLYCNIIEGNQPSIGLFEGVGFKQTGVKQSWLKTPQGFLDVRFYQYFLNK